MAYALKESLTCAFEACAPKAKAITKPPPFARYIANEDMIDFIVETVNGSCSIPESLDADAAPYVLSLYELLNLFRVECFNLG